MVRFFAFIVAIAIAGNVNAQTSRRIVAWPTTTSGAVISDTTSSLLVDGTSLGTRSISLTNLGTAVLSTQTLVNSLTVSTSNGVMRLTPTTGVGALSLAQTTTGVLTLSSLVINSSGLGATSWTQSMLQVIPTTTSAVVTANLTGTGGILFGRNSGGGSSISTSSGITSTNLPAGLTYGITATDNNIYLKTDSGRSVYFMDASIGYVAAFGSTGLSFMSGAGSNLSGLYSSTASYLKSTAGTTNSLGTFYTGGLGLGYRAVTGATALTITDGVVSGSSSSAFTLTLPDATTLTGRMVMIPNTGSATLTISGLTTAQAINSAQTTTIVTNSMFIGISTGTTWIGQRVAQ